MTEKQLLIEMLADVVPGVQAANRSTNRNRIPGGGQRPASDQEQVLWFEVLDVIQKRRAAEIAKKLGA